jgi:hypothetical protein
MRRANWVAAALLAGSVIFALIVLEAGLRLYEGVHVLRVTNFIRDQVDQLRVHIRSVYDERLGWAPKPNVHDRFFNTGSYGIRLGNKVDRPVPQGAILVSGSSFAFGEEVDDNESWPADLETMTGIPVINAAAGAWSTDQVVMRTEDMIEIARPKTIILGLVWHDAWGAEYEINFGARKPYYTAEAGNLVLHNVPVPRFAGSTQELGWVRSVLGYSYTVFWIAQRLNLHDWLYAGHAEFKRATPVGTGEQITCLLLRRLRERTEREGIRLMLVMQYHYQDLQEAQPPLSKTILKCADDVGVDTIDSWRRLAEVLKDDPARFASLFNHGPGSHMSPAGNRLIASEIVRKMQTGN